MFLLFAWKHPFSSGGFNDYIRHFTDAECALSYVDKYFDTRWSWQVVDASADFEILSESTNIESLFVDANDIEGATN